MQIFNRITCLTCAASALLAGCATTSPRADACSDALAMQVKNSCIVTQKIIWRGAKPDSAAATELLNRGVRVVVNLELIHDDKDAFRNARPALLHSVQVDYFRIRDWEPNVVIAPWLLDRHVAEFIGITRSQAKPIYVHCRSGQNRTGVMVAAFRVLEEGVPIETAIEEMAAYQGVWFKEDAEYIGKLTGKRSAKIRAMAAEQITGLHPEARLTCTSAGCSTK